MVGTNVTTCPITCSFTFKISMIFGAFECVNANRLSDPKHFVFIKNIFCLALVPGLKFPVKRFSVQTSTDAGAANGAPPGALPGAPPGTPHNALPGARTGTSPTALTSDIMLAGSNG